MNRLITKRKATPRALLGAALLSVLLGGCGGVSTTKEQIVPTRATSPTVYGLQPEAALNQSTFLQASGLASPDAATGYVTGAVDYSGTPLATQTGPDGKIPLGFAPGGRYVDTSLAQAAPAGGSVIFGAYIANGIDAATGRVVPINPNGVTLTTRRADGTEEVAGFSVPLSFAVSPQGPLANATYRTAPFTLPFTTSGLHSLSVTVTDARGAGDPLGSSTTFFDVVVLTPSDAAAVAQVLDAAGKPVPGATVTITNAVAGARAQTTADARGVVVLFAAPGTQTITVTGTNLNYTANVTLTAGQALTTNAEGAALTIAPPASAS